MSENEYPNDECSECSVWLCNCAIPREKLIELCEARGCSLLNNTDKSSGE